MEMEKPEKKVIDKFYIKIYIDYLEFSKKYISEFGISFRPIIEIQMGTEVPTKLTLIDEEKENENVSGDDTGNSSFLTENTQNSIINLNRNNSNILKDEKIKMFSFKSVRTF